MKNKPIPITTLLIVVFSFFIGATLYFCTRGANALLNQNNESTAFFSYDHLQDLNKNVILSPEDYSASGFKEMRQRHGMMPEILANKVKEYLSYLSAVFSQQAIQDVLEVGTPVWNRSRFQGVAGEPVIMLVPLITTNGTSISGMLTIEIDETGFVSWQTERRDELLEPYLASRQVNDGQELVRLLSVAAFDKYLFDHKFLPTKYGLDPRDADYHQNFSAQVSLRDLDEFIFLSSCYQLTVTYEGNELSRIICETVRIRITTPTTTTDPPNPPNPPTTGGVPGNPQGNLRDGNTNREHCEWEWPIVGVYSGSGPLDGLAWVIGNSQYCYFSGGGSIVPLCEKAPYWNMQGNCSANLEVQDRGSQVSAPVNNAGRVRSRYRIVNNSTGIWGITAAFSDVIGVAYEWNQFTSNSSIIATATRYYHIRSTMLCYDGCQ